MPFRTTPWRAYLRRIRASSDAAKRRWIVVVGSGTGALVIALWVVYLSTALPTRTNTSPTEATTTSEFPKNRAGDTFTSGIRGIRDMFSERWQGAQSALGASWRSLEALITEGNEFSVTGTTTPASPDPNERRPPPQMP